MRAPLLVLLLYIATTHQTHANTSPPPSPTSQDTSTSPTTTTTGENSNTRLEGTWQNAVLNVLNQFSNPQRTGMGNNSVDLNDILARLPGVFQGLGGVDLRGNDVGTLLANLFADPRAAGTPAWLEALTQNFTLPASLVQNSTQTTNTVQNVPDLQTLMSLLTNNPQASQSLSNLMQMMTLNSNVGSDVTMNVLGRVFNDVTKGLRSLPVNSNSSLPEIMAAVMNDSSLMSSLSSDALQLVSTLTGNSDPAALLMSQFPLDPQSQCAQDLQAWGSALMSQEMWAMAMLDASGKLQSGILTGQVGLVGDYDQCVEISTSSNTQHDIHGQLCEVQFPAPEFLTVPNAPGIPMWIHLCMPKSCQEEHVYGLTKPTIELLGSKPQLSGVTCLRPPNPEGDNWFLGVAITMGILILLCTAGTLYGMFLDNKQEKCQKQPIKPAEPSTKSDSPNDTAGNSDYVNVEPINGQSEKSKVDLNAAEGVMTNGKNGTAVVIPVNGTAKPSDKTTSGQNETSSKPGLGSQLLLSFSVLRNGQKLLSTARSSSDITCLHGIRVLSISWVVLGHAFSMFGGMAGNLNATFVFMSIFPYMAVLGGLFAVDTFFLLSGCLTALLFLRSTRKSGVTVSGMVLYYVHRFWRLTPLYALILFFYAGIYPYTLEGPYQNKAAPDATTACRKYWHFNLLYINNLVDDSYSKMCVGWSWYLSNDMQFFVIAPLALIPWTLKGSLRRVKIVGFVICTALILTHVICTGVISFNHNAHLFGTNDVFFFAKVYIVPWCRVGPYAIGLLLGYCLFVTNVKYSMSKVSAILGWTLAVAVGLTVVYVRYDDVHDYVNTGTHNWTNAQQSAIDALDKVLWSLCVAWVIFACSTGYGGFVNTLLSWKAWVPLSRLSYGVYMIHIVIMLMFAGNFKKPFYMDGWSGTSFFLAMEVLSFLASFAFSLLLEAPCLGLDKAVLGRVFRQKK